MPSIDGNTSMMQNLLNCPFEVIKRSPCDQLCDQLYRLVSVKEDEDGVVTMTLELVEEDDA